MGVKIRKGGEWLRGYAGLRWITQGIAWLRLVTPGYAWLFIVWRGTQVYLFIRKTYNFL